MRPHHAAVPTESLADEPSPARVEAFSDGVFAIIITLLVLDLRAPRADALAGTTLANVLLHQWPVYAGYALSFLQVGVVWSNHHSMFHNIRRSDHLLVGFNLLLLLCVAVLPFTTSLLAEYIRGNPDERRLVSQIYSGALAISGVFFNAIWQHALSSRLVDLRSDPNRLYALRRHWLLMPVFYAVAFVLAWVSVQVSMAIHVALLVYYALPGPGVIRWVTAREARRVSDAAALSSRD